MLNDNYEPQIQNQTSQAQIQILQFIYFVSARVVGIQ